MVAHHELYAQFRDLFHKFYAAAMYFVSTSILQYIFIIYTYFKHNYLTILVILNSVGK